MAVYAGVFPGRQPSLTGGMGVLVVVYGLLAGALVLTVSITWLFRRVDACKTAPQRTPRTIVRSWMPRLTALTLVCWSPYFVIYFPGNYDSDTMWQIEEVYGLVPASDHHPWFDTVTFGLFWRIGDVLGSHAWSLAIFSVLQMVITALVLSLAVCYLGYIGAPSAMIKGSAVFFALFPAIPTFAETMAKDTFFGWVWVLFTIFVMEIARTRGACLRSWPALAAFGAVICLVMLTKKTGAILVVITCLALLIYIHRTRLRLAVALVVAMALFNGLWTSVLLPAWGVAPGQASEMMSIPVQETALYVKRNASHMRADDWKVLSGIYSDPQRLGQAYVPGRSDSARSYWRQRVSGPQLQAYAGWMARSFAKDPYAFLAAPVATALPLFYPVADSQQNALFYGRGLPGGAHDHRLENTLMLYSHGKASRGDVQRLLQGTYSASWVVGVYDSFHSWYMQMAKVAPVLFGKVLYATWIPLFALCYCARKRRGAGAISLVPAVLMLASLFAGPIVLVRYMVPVVYVAPLVLGAMFLRTHATQGGVEGNPGIA